MKYRTAARPRNHKHHTFPELRELADRAFSRAAGAPLLEGNHVRLLRDARENYPAWLDAISSAKHHINFENYIIHEDDTGRLFADALISKAREGVAVRLIYDWLGCLGIASRKFWNSMREGGVEVRCYNPPRFDSPFGWVSRDHRKMVSVDGKAGYVSGLCLGRMWEGIPEKKLDPWRDTGVEVRGCAVADIDRAFAQVWAMTGDPIPGNERNISNESEAAGDIGLRIVASIPSMAGMFRLDQLVAALARKRLWLMDAYYAGTNNYVQALNSASKDGVDVRLLVPNGTDIPVLRPLSRAGYRPLLEAGVRVFEWNGTMLHAKTAVADGLWARVGSTNLNVSSWFGNCELDVVVENKPFACEMEDMYLDDLENSTELVLDAKQKVRASGQRRRRHPVMARGRGSMGRAAAGAVRIGNTVGAAITDRRVLEPIEARLMTGGGFLFLVAAALIVIFPRALAFALSAVFLWFGIVLLYRGYRLNREKNMRKPSAGAEDFSEGKR
jgi:cardiolipin synthase A/B